VTTPTSSVRKEEFYAIVRMAVEFRVPISGDTMAMASERAGRLTESEVMSCFRGQWKVIGVMKTYTDSVPDLN